MTLPKRPLPSLRFIITSRGGTVLFRLIPQTTPKGRVMQDLWAVPGDSIQHTSQLGERCKAQGWRWRIEGASAAPRRKLSDTFAGHTPSCPLRIGGDCRCDSDE